MHPGRDKREMALKKELTFELIGRKVVKGKARGEALVTREPISFLGGVDPSTGDVTEKGHELEGCNVTGKILIYPTGKGSTGGSYCIYDMAHRKTAPAALINIEAEPVTAIGAILGNIPMIDHVEPNPLDVIKTGDLVDVDADAGIIRVRKRGQT